MYYICPKQRINLSRQAEEIIRYDIECFAEDSEKVKFGGAVNRIFRFFCHHAMANIPAVLAEERRKLDAQLDDAPVEIEAKKKTISCLLDKKEHEIMEIVGRLIRKKADPNSSTLYVQDENRKYLESSDVSHLVGKYYRNTWQFIKAVIEEYTEKPYIEREAIFFNEIIQKIRLAGDNYLIISSGGNRYMLRPYGIEPDSLSAYNYLVGYSTRISGDDRTEATENLASFRIARISDVVVLDEGKPLSNAERTMISDAIVVKGVQFLVGSPTEIRVRLTEGGMREYKRQISMRPLYNKYRSSGYELVFECTEWQAFVYFIKFGKEAEVLSPENLRSRFYNMYSEAKEAYGPVLEISQGGSTFESTRQDHV